MSHLPHTTQFVGDHVRVVSTFRDVEKHGSEQLLVLRNSTGMMLVALGATVKRNLSVLMVRHMGRIPDLTDGINISTIFASSYFSSRLLSFSLIGISLLSVVSISGNITSEKLLLFRCRFVVTTTQLLHE
jgi:hypothetical protein